MKEIENALIPHKASKTFLQNFNLQDAQLEKLIIVKYVDITGVKKFITAGPKYHTCC